MPTRTLVGAGNRLVRMTTQLSNRIRGVMKTSGLPGPAGKGRKFERNVRHLLSDRPDLAAIVLPLLDAWRGGRTQVAALGTRLVATGCQSRNCRLRMSVPGVGAVTATSFVAAIEDPANFGNAGSVGARVGLTTRRYRSGKVDHDGQISRRGDRHLRWPLHEAAAIIPTRVRADSSLRTWDARAARQDRLQARRSCRGPQTGRDHAGDARDRRVPRSETGGRDPTSGEWRSGSERLSRPCRDLGRAIPVMGVHRRPDSVRHPH